MFISHKNNIIQQVRELEWQCRMHSKGMSTDEYWPWLESVTTDGVADYSGETGYTIVECKDEDVWARLVQLDDYISIPLPPKIKEYNIKWQDDIGNAEEILGEDGKSQDPKVYVQSHFVPDDSAKDARLLADVWTSIRSKRDRLLTNSDWTQGSDSPLASGKKTEWATYRTKLRTLPEDQKDKTTFASITWPSQPS